MLKLSEKVVNCYKNYLTKLNYGITEQDYSLLYGAVLMLKTGVTDKKYKEFFYNNLLCTSTIVLDPIEDRMITWTINSNANLVQSFVWTEFSSIYAKTYPIETNELAGYNYFYVTVPEAFNVKIYDEMSNLVFDSAVAGNWQFTYKGTIKTSKGNTNKVYRKINVFNTIHPVKFYIKLY